MLLQGSFITFYIIANTTVSQFCVKPHPIKNNTQFHPLIPLVISRVLTWLQVELENLIDEQVCSQLGGYRKEVS